MKTRFLSLDILRGITLAGMILVNNTGNGEFTYSPLLHAEWNGFTPTDLVFPSFLFMVGVAMRFSFKTFNYELTPSVRNKILKRTLYLFLINYFVFYFPFTDFSFEKLRFLNVLPRIALSYCAVSFLTLQVPSKWLTWINAGILLSFWGILYFFGDAGLWMDISSNAVRKLDLFLFSESHLYHGNVVNGIALAFDPEGFLSTLPAISTCLFGYQVSLYLETQAKENKSALLGLLGWGAALILLAVIWDYDFPINKKLWTSSFVLLCAGIDFILIGLLNWWIETKERHFGNTFFLVFGTNSILAYGISEVIAIQLGNVQIQDMSASQWLYWHLFEPIFGKYNGSLAYAITFVLVCWGVCWVFWKKRIFLKV
ncbi:heparan-alpha-glucosaminide N-acetyltransferase domain-containing protein [Aquirufa sp. HETE-83D]|uniref:Heparan-alpha-glucosaminide N-acetyltransferase domain-containing protein n=1 Tax=Aquirufa esocilacus TaxID=3096513 RepID=A0ABW6DJZ0_9BACT